MVVENNAYVVELSCYIHRNPLRAGMVNLERTHGRHIGITSMPMLARRNGCGRIFDTALFWEAASF
jgi:type 1 glutamine amidotransferase